MVPGVHASSVSRQPLLPALAGMPTGDRTGNRVQNRGSFLRSSGGGIDNKRGERETEGSNGFKHTTVLGALLPCVQKLSVRKGGPLIHPRLACTGAQNGQCATVSTLIAWMHALGQYVVSATC